MVSDIGRLLHIGSDRYLFRRGIEGILYGFSDTPFRNIYASRKDIDGGRHRKLQGISDHVAIHMDAESTWKVSVCSHIYSDNRSVCVAC